MNMEMMMKNPMKISDYMKYATLFQRMEDEHIKTIGAELDKYFPLNQGDRQLYNQFAQMIVKKETPSVTDPDLIEITFEVSEENQATVAGYVESLYLPKWRKLFEFVDANLQPWIDRQSVLRYNRALNSQKENGGKDETIVASKIAAFNSPDFVDTDENATTKSYGMQVKSEDTGGTETVSQRMETQAEKLVTNTLLFWQTNGITKRVFDDTAKAIGLSLWASHFMKGGTDLDETTRRIVQNS